MGLVPVLFYGWLVSYLITFPLIFAHLGIIIVLWKSPPDPTNYFVMNLSFGVIVQQLQVGLIVIEHLITIWRCSVLCGLRAIFIRPGTPLISFSLVLLVVQGTYFTRHPRQRNSVKKNTSFKIILLVLILSIVVSIPYYFMRAYDPEVESVFKCVQVLLLDSVIVDSVYRFILFLILGCTPAVILLCELKKLTGIMKHQNLTLSHEFREVEAGMLKQFQFAETARRRLNFMKNSFVFILLFLCFSLPHVLIDTINSPAITYSADIKHYKTNIDYCLFLFGYIVIQIYPVYMFYLDRYWAHC